MFWVEVHRGALDTCDEVLGKGAFGEVMAVKVPHRIRGRHVAIKQENREGEPASLVFGTSLIKGKHLILDAVFLAYLHRPPEHKYKNRTQTFIPVMALGTYSNIGIASGHSVRNGNMLRNRQLPCNRENFPQGTKVTLHTSKRCVILTSCNTLG